MRGYGMLVCRGGSGFSGRKGEAVYYETSVTAFAAAPGPSLTLKGMAGHCLCEEDGQVEAWLTSPYPSAQDLEESARRMEREFGWDRCADRFVSIIERE